MADVILSNEGVDAVTFGAAGETILEALERARKIEA
jgi:hypothetical protein